MIDVPEMVQAAHREAAAFELSAWRFLAVRGDDRARFLHALLSSAVEGVGVGSGNRAVLLTDKGKLVADLHVLVGVDEVLLAVHDARRDALRETLVGYVVADDVALEARDLRVVSLVGPRSDALARTLLGHGAPTVGWEQQAAQWSGAPAILTRLLWSALPSTEIIVAAETAEGLLTEAARHGAVLGTQAAAEVLRVEAGTPAWGHELTQDVIPLEAGLEGALHQTKGCYVGQETIARVLSRGHVNWLVVGLRLDSQFLPLRGDPVLVGEKEVGRVTSAARSPSLGTIALARVRREQAEPGTRLLVRRDEERLTGQVGALPFA